MINKKAFNALALLWLGTLLGAGLAFLIQIILARKLGSEYFGMFSAVLAMVTLVTPLAGFGISQLWLKVFGQEGWNARKWLKSSLNFVILSTSVVFISLYLWAFLGNHDQLTRLLFLILSFYILGQISAELVSSKLQLEERYLYLAIWQFLPHFMRFILIVILLFGFNDWASIEKVAYVYAFVAIVFLLVGILQLINMHKGNFTLKGHKKEDLQKSTTIKLSRVLENAWPFGLAAFFHLIYFQSDIILIKYMVGDNQAGIYNVAFTVMVAVYMFPNVLYQKFLLPKLHRWANHDKDKFYEVYRKGNIIMLILGLLAMLLVWTLSAWAIPFLFGNEYQNSILILNILAVSSPIIFVAFSAGATLVTQEHMKLKVKFMGAVALINLVLNFIFIPIYGAVGAAVSTVISNFILLMLYYYGAQQYVFYKSLFIKDTLKARKLKNRHQSINNKM